jgi:hypothetical protein
MTFLEDVNSQVGFYSEGNSQHGSATTDVSIKLLKNFLKNTSKKYIYFEGFNTNLGTANLGTVRHYTRPKKQ